MTPTNNSKAYKSYAGIRDSVTIYRDLPLHVHEVLSAITPGTYIDLLAASRHPGLAPAANGLSEYVCCTVSTNGLLDDVCATVPAIGWSK